MAAMPNARPSCLIIEYRLELESWVIDVPSMGMPMMHVGIVSVNVDQRQVNVRVTVRFPAVPSSRVGMLVVRIVRMCVRMFLLLVCVQMTVMFGKVKPDAARHEQSRSDERPCNDIALNQHR